jgi:hypothetical protein
MYAAKNYACGVWYTINMKYNAAKPGLLQTFLAL